MARDPLLVLLARWPRLGRVKTRLADAVGDAGALALHRGMLADAERRLERARQAGWETLVLWHDGDAPGPELAARVAGSAGEGLQRGDDLGERMAAAMDEGLAVPRPGCVLIGADCPTFPDCRLDEALEALRRSDLVVGPAEDGGYYLIGARRPVPEIFAGLPWGTGSVLALTLEAAAAAGATIHRLPAHYDVDVAEDLERLRLELVPDGSEARSLAAGTLAALERLGR